MRGTYTRRVELIPKAVIAGLFVQTVPMSASTGPTSILLQQPGAAPVTRDVVNRIWSDVVKRYPYQSLQFDPTGSGGAFLGQGPDDAVILQPPLLQVRDAIGVGGVREASDKLQFVFNTALHHLGGPAANLGVKLVYHAPAPGAAAVDFLLSELVKGVDDVQSLAGGMSFEGSVKFLLTAPDVQYTLLIEPLHADLAFLYLDLDAQFPGPLDPAKIGERVRQAETLITTQVRNFLEKRGEEWSR